ASGRSFTFLPGISYDDSVWVEHWHNLEDKPVPQLVGSCRVPFSSSQKVRNKKKHEKNSFRSKYARRKAHVFNSSKR
ncbi:MAG: hypothetical protein ACK559_05300, partial [bacterium]